MCKNSTATYDFSTGIPLHGGIAPVETNTSHRTDILSGWKEISSYLRMGVRTAQRYEEFGLPVRRPAGRRRGSVIATKAELDTWITARPIRQTPQPAASGLPLSPTWTDFRAGIAEMKRLRTEMMRLRTKAVISLEALHARVSLMQGATGEKLRKFANSPVPAKSRRFSADPVSNWLIVDSYPQQAN
jgi:hypothetical protein